MEMVQSKGGRDVLREVTLYNLDAIIAVGYRVNCYTNRVTWGMGEGLVNQ